MHIAGGLYRELCETPTWNAQFGSGGRAAAAVSAMSPGSTLHTYARDGNNAGADELSALGVQLSRTHSDIAIAFAYFHPLSQPHIEPRPGTIPQEPPIHVSGEVVLRFGFLEGSALVHAAKAIYDPQTAVHPEPFGANGSTAKRLALVMNELELCRYTGCPDLATAAGNAMSNDNQVTVIVVKRGVRGVTVYERNVEPITVPAYYSSQVFKIGTGDVFSAVFAHHWGEAGTSAPEAADLASRSVSAYCETMTLPVPTESLKSREPVTGQAPSRIILHGSTSTIGRRYTLEEARFRLKELGIDALSPQLDEIPEPLSKNLPSLVVADGLSTTEIRRLCETKPYRGIIVLDEERRPDVAELSSLGVTIISDFASSLYRSAWPRAFCRS
ncbi:Nucleoside deoxyribosyltransferase [Roseomonas mucosa]|uniref:carbohydrate kinase family protein n=1 Tax=Pseudomonadota TaxID=1224 RepID=UPI00178C663C|nr:carbohydrate kinase family protein [Roseomonas mucosa]QDD95234.1 Nucleoside deoxyribosyltransferase [Roseomonas mucosa]